MFAIWLFVRRLLSFQTCPTNDINFEMDSNQDSDGECELDSTWEDEHENKTPCKKKCRRNMRAAKDMQDFRHSCQNLDHGDDEPGPGGFYNLEFYRGQIRSSPDDIHIDDFHKLWWGQYNQLENVHTYIQWLFPLQVPGMNRRAQVLTKKEIKHFRRDKQAQSKLVKSYEIMLDFYGTRLVNKDTGEVERAKNWKQRFNHINRHTLNNLRITRILKCLGTLGLEHYQAPLVKFLLHETLVMGELPSVKQSVLDYFMFAVLDKSKRKELIRYAYEHFRPREDFVWGPKKVLQKETSKEGQQQRVRTRDCTHEMNKIHAGPPPEGIGIDKPCKNGQQKDTKRAIPNTLKENNITSVQRANKKSQCSTKSKKAEKQSQGMSVEVEIKLETIVHDDDLNEKTNTSDISISANEPTKENIQSDQGSSIEETVKNQEMSVGDEDKNDDSIEMTHGE